MTMARMCRWLTLAGVIASFPVAGLHADSREVDLTHAVVLTSPKTSPERKAVEMLIEEVEKRTRVRWQRAEAAPAGQAPAIVVGKAADVRGLMRAVTWPLPGAITSGFVQLASAFAKPSGSLICCINSALCVIGYIST